MTVTNGYCHVPPGSWDRDAATPEVPGLLISRARGILSRIDDSFPWTADNGRPVLMARDELAEALDAHGRLRTGQLHPELEFPELEHETEALEIALGKVAEDIGDWAEALVMMIAEHCGEEVAAYVSGAQGSRSEC